MPNQRLSDRRTGGLGIVGPTHPLKGGIAQHTAELARQAADRGLDVRIESWRAQYPRRLYPGVQEVPAGSTEGPPFPQTNRRLRWWNPGGWLLAGWRLRAMATVALVVVVPFHAIPYSVLLAVLRAGRTRPQVVLICHNVLPHEPHPLDEPLMRVLIGRPDAVVVHTAEQAELARALGARAVREAALPPSIQFAPHETAVGRPVSRRLLFFGFVRPYKGLDDLLAALVQVDCVHLTVCGEVWGEAAEVSRVIADLGLAHRVTVEDRYIRAEDIPELFRHHDAVVAPYRASTASQLVWLANRLGLPIIATRVGSFRTDIYDGRNGLLCNPGDPAGLAAAIRRLYQPGVLEGLRRQIANVDTSSRNAWDIYVEAVTGHRRT